MNLALPLAQTSIAPLFGNQWLALLAVLGGVAIFMIAIAVAGRWLAATHPDPANDATRAGTAPTPKEIVSGSPTSPELIAVIAAAVASEVGRNARISLIRPLTPSIAVETLMQQWSLEGRRQIYSSHQIR